MLSVVVPCRNDAPLLGRQLAALADQVVDEPFEVVVVDNGSTDDSAQVARRFADRLAVRVVSLDGPPGVARARNAGVAAAAGDRLVFVDADDVVGPGYLAALDAALDRDEFVAARLELDRLNPSWLVRSRNLPQSGGLNDQFDFLPYAFGGSLGITRDRFDAVGGFPEGRQYGDDVEFCWLVQLAGTPLRYVPDAVVHYRLRADAGPLFAQARRYGRSNAYYYRRYRHHGMPRTSTWRRLVAWVTFGARLALIARREERLRLLYEVGIGLGRIRGSVEQRVLYL
jgi:glycosyltransferase involved in cell wall biosynthesis